MLWFSGDIDDTSLMIHFVANKLDKILSLENRHLISSG